MGRGAGRGWSWRAAVELWGRAPLPAWLRGGILWATHQRYLIGVVGVIWDDAGRVLLARHRYKPGTGWELPGGWLGRGETLEACLRRELAEELGAAVRIGPLVCWGEKAVPRHWTFGFACQLDALAFRPGPEVAAIAWFSPPEALRLLPAETRPLLRQAVRWRGAATSRPATETRSEEPHA
ncbi:MAG TPA: NUDIX hydrolase [Chloroflexota bacterium]|jgi:ADP-ribose pyrophosphatase YjhB (NUDIX family)|nr:NUDIX hydrolase [Chloroflexota bacterium]